MRVKVKDLVVGKLYHMNIPGNTGRFHSIDLDWNVIAFQHVTGDIYIVDYDGLIRFVSEGGYDLEEVED